MRMPVPTTAPGAAALGRLTRRLRGDFEIDEWGLDPELIDLADPLISLRWEIDVVNAERIPAVGPAVLVFNRRFGLSEPWILARAIRKACGRYVRTIGVPDAAPVGPALRRFGGVLARQDEIAGLLAAGQLVGLPTARQPWTTDRVGPLSAEHLEAVYPTEAAVVPVALVGHELRRRWRVIIGQPTRPRRRAGPLAGAELAESTRQACQIMLDEALPGRSWWG